MAQEEFGSFGERVMAEVKTHDWNQGIIEAGKSLLELLGEMYATDTSEVFDSERCVSTVENLQNQAENWVDTARLHMANEVFWKERAVRFAIHIAEGHKCVCSSPGGREFCTFHDILTEAQDVLNMYVDEDVNNDE